MAEGRAGQATPQSRAGGILIPVLPGIEPQSLIPAGEALRNNGRLLLLGVIPVEPPRSLSKAAGEAQQLRSQLLNAVRGSTARARPKILVSHRPEEEIVAEANQLRVDLALLPWLGPQSQLHVHFERLLSRLACTVALLRGSLPPPGSPVLVVLRAGPDSQAALRLVLQLAASRAYRVSTVRILDSPADDQEQADLEAIEQVLSYLPQVAHRELSSEQPVGSVLTLASGAGMIVIGASRGQQGELDPLTQGLLESSRGSTLVARAARQRREAYRAAPAGLEAISILVDKWFAENTFHTREFEELEELLARKRRSGLSISLALPSLNEERTVGKVIRTIQQTLVDQFPLLDELVLIDSNSSDRTRQIAEGLGVPVYIHQDILPKYGPRSGKGEALWKSLYVTRGDLLLWIDTDIVNIHPRFVYGLIGPLLLRRDLMLVKGFYLRPMRVGRSTQAGGGGRVTELTARPLLNLFYPALSGLVQPLSGEYGGRREALERMPFSSGYGVETGLLIDVLEQFGLSAIGQVDLLERVHHNQPLTALSMMSFAIIQTVMRKLDRRYGRQLLRDINRSMKIIRHSKARFFLEVEEIAERERPPMIELPEYQERLGRQ